MSGDQEPWVFRGGLVADLQVSYSFFFCLINYDLNFSILTILLLYKNYFICIHITFKEILKLKKFILHYYFGLILFGFKYILRIFI